MSIMPIIVHKLPIVNSPKISPKKNGVAFLNAFSPPYLRITNFVSQAMKNTNQTRFIVQLPDKAYPTGWSCQPINLVLIVVRKVVNDRPASIANIEG